MRTLRRLLPALLLALLVTGCGPTRLKTRGKVLKGGVPLLPARGEMVRVIFVPMLGGGQRARDYYVAEFKAADGTFQVAGKDLKGMPPGKYRVTVEHLRHKKDLLNGAFGEDNSPFVREVTSSSQELILDLDRPNN